MGDSENVQQPSKKRAALKELSRDNPGLDDEDDSSAFESGTFKTASEEVLATRRIVKVKRRDPSAAAAAPAANPFAGICLVPSAPAPASETKEPVADATKETDVDKKDQEEVTDTDTTKDSDGGEKDKSEAITTGEDGGAETKINDETKTSAGVEDATGEETEKAEAANGSNNTDKGNDCVDKDSGADRTEKEGKEGDGSNGDNGALSSFQQHSSSKNAFTGLASTGFSTSSFSFGLVSQEGSTGSGSGSLTAQSSFSFGQPNNGSFSLFGTSGSAPLTTKSADTTTGFPSKQEVSVETGEENEKAAFTADSVMFEYLEGGWKERGKGELKVNISTTDNSKARLVMRSKGNYRLILNASIYPEMKLASMDKKGITFACVNSVSEAKNGLSTFALKFKDPTVVEEFRAVIEEHKKSKPAVVEAAALLKTPENSPEA